MGPGPAFRLLLMLLTSDPMLMAPHPQGAGGGRGGCGRPRQRGPGWRQAGRDVRGGGGDAARGRAVG
jgi:hypothetical protein